MAFIKILPFVMVDPERSRRVRKCHEASLKFPFKATFVLLTHFKGGLQEKGVLMAEPA
jgi:hypothetical protein